jgi:hypothetical protein
MRFLDYLESILIVLSVLGVAGMIFATQFTKWTDRRNNRRWWEDTPGSRRR